MKEILRQQTGCASWPGTIPTRKHPAPRRFGQYTPGPGKRTQFRLPGSCVCQVLQNRMSHPVPLLEPPQFKGGGPIPTTHPAYPPAFHALSQWSLAKRRVDVRGHPGRPQHRVAAMKEGSDPPDRGRFRGFSGSHPARSARPHRDPGRCARSRRFPCTPTPSEWPWRRRNPTVPERNGNGRRQPTS
jgi:hypothetical protein